MIKEIGRKLCQAREEKSLTHEQVSRELRIRVQYLKALEEGDLGVLPSAVQVRGFLRSYADFLGLNPNELLLSLQQPADSASPEAQPKDTPGADSSSPGTLVQVEAIFKEIGTAIQGRRETLGLSLDDIEQHTHIQGHYAKLIENGDFTSFPSPIQARGMLSNYADFLEMDSNAVLLRYADALQTRLSIFQASSEAPKPKPAPSSRQIPRLPRWLGNILSPDVAIFGTIGIVIVFVTIWAIGRTITTTEARVSQPTAPPLASVLLPSATGEPFPTATNPTTATPETVIIDEGITEEETAAPTLLPISQAAIQLYIIVHQRAYLKVTVDGIVEFEGRVIPGSNLPFSASQQIEVLTGNAAALQIFFNDIDLGTLGIYGEVVNLIYTRDGAILPTAQPTPTTLPEDLVTPTPTPMPTSTQVVPPPPPENTPPP
jgi:cytoskeletal protein RodZ